LVIGVGNELRGDDAAGIAVARRLRESEELEVDLKLDVRELQGEPTGLLDAWQGRDAVVLVDTMRSGARPGAIRRIDVSQTRLPSGLGGSTSTHAVGLGDTIELARTLGRLPGRVVVYAIEGRRFEAGAPMSDAVRSGIDELAERVLNEVRADSGAGAAEPLEHG
jgi:hydrogenase maturation protease